MAEPQILEGEVTIEELETLIDRFIEETYEPPLQEVRDATKEQVTEALVSPLSDEELKAQKKADLRKEFEVQLQQGNVIVAKENDKVVGMCKFFQFEAIIDPELNGQTVFEIGRIYVAEAARGQKIAEKMTKAAMELITRKSGPHAMLMCSKEVPIKKACQNLGWEKITMQRYLNIRGFTPEPHIIKIVDDQGYVGYLYNPTSAS